eukprot:SRR837773.7773.p1 GENE.SRR837773.7773~~SRR837773.7773.p1  ORF type:complete len:107 (-),score=4.91 SRR837773.7773:284-574(-)
MAPREESGSTHATLQARLDSIAQQAKARNPDGFRLAPIESLRSDSPQRSVSGASSGSDDSSSENSESGKTYYNAHSGQQIVLMSGVRNMAQHLQIC